MPLQRYKRSLHIAQIIERPADRARARAPKLLQQLTEKLLPNNKSNQAKLQTRRSKRAMGEDPVAKPDAVPARAKLPTRRSKRIACQDPAQAQAHRALDDLRAQKKDIPPTGPDGEERNFGEEEDDETLMMMEYYSHGSLDQALRNNQERGFPKRVLWHLFDCSEQPPSPPTLTLVITELGTAVIRGLIGLEYPPLKQKFTDYKDDYGPPISETIPAANSRVATNLVHCDLDPQNSKAATFIPCLAPSRADDVFSLSLYRRLPRGASR